MMPGNVKSVNIDFSGTAIIGLMPCLAEVQCYFPEFLCPVI